MLCFAYHLLLICFTSKINPLKYQFFFSIRIFFHDHSRTTGLQGKGEGISVTPHYHFYPLHRHLDISRATTAESLPLHIASSQTLTGNLWFPSASRQPPSYAPYDDICFADDKNIQSTAMGL